MCVGKSHLGFRKGMAKKKKKARGGVCAYVCVCRGVCWEGGTDCHSPKDTRLSFLFSAPCFIYRPFCPIWLLIMRAHSSTDVRGRHSPTDIVIRARHVAGHLQRGWGTVFGEQGPQGRSVRRGHSLSIRSSVCNVI